MSLIGKVFRLSHEEGSTIYSFTYKIVEEGQEILGQKDTEGLVRLELVETDYGDDEPIIKAYHNIMPRKIVSLHVQCHEAMERFFAERPHLRKSVV